MIYAKNFRAAIVVRIIFSYIIKNGILTNRTEEMASKKEKYPVLPLRDIVVYPKMIVPLFVGREKSIRALQEVVDNDKNIVLATQKTRPSKSRLPMIFIISALWAPFFSC